MVRNWNWCLSQARGEYIKFLFGDDKPASREALGKLLQLLETNASVALAASARHVVGEHSEVLETWDDFRQPGVHHGTEVIAQCLEQDRNLIGEPSAALFRRRCRICNDDLNLRKNCLSHKFFKASPHESLGAVGRDDDGDLGHLGGHWYPLRIR